VKLKAKHAQGNAMAFASLLAVPTTIIYPAPLTLPSDAHIPRKIIGTGFLPNLIG
jgi:hypothetical protein